MQNEEFQRIRKSSGGKRIPGWIQLAIEVAEDYAAATSECLGLSRGGVNLLSRGLPATYVRALIRAFLRGFSRSFVEMTKQLPSDALNPRPLEFPNF